MPQPQVRVGGSGFTLLYFDKHPIAWLQNFNDSGQTPQGGPSGRNAEPIYELGLNRPKEIVTAYVVGPGTIQATIAETWNYRVWEHLRGMGGAKDILDIYDRLRRNSERVTCHMLIKPPQGVGPVRGKIYHGCVVSGIDDGENISIGTLSMAKNVTIQYTHTTPLTTTGGLSQEFTIPTP